MTERINHAASARGAIYNAENLLEAHDDSGAGAKAAIAVANATLALVEQQRIANLIAYWQLHIPRSAEESFEHRYIEVSTLAADIDVYVTIREGLGL